jgi:DNA-3-methyladenine glycosylase I
LWRKVDWENGLNISEMNEQIRCPWPDDPLYREYHDREWGVPVIDDRELFEFLILEGAQAGLSWITVLRKREAYRRAFSGFDPLQVAVYDAKRTAQLLGDSGLIRNRRKIAAAVTNARAFLEVQSEHFCHLSLAICRRTASAEPLVYRKGNPHPNHKIAYA